MPDVQNEPDEVILPPMDFLITKIDEQRSMVHMQACHGDQVAQHVKHRK